jgi:hypothetical protein
MQSTIDKLQDYIFTKERLDAVIGGIYVPEKEEVEKVLELKTSGLRKHAPGQGQKGEQAPKREAYTPYQKDKLFWCFYAMLHGVEACEQARQHSFKTEMDNKYKLISTLREHKSELSSLGMKISEVEVELVSQREISFQAFRALCHACSLPVVYHHDRWFMQTGGEGDAKYIVRKVGRDHQLVLHGVSEETEKLRKEIYEIVDPKKPIWAISRYMVADVQDICKRLSIPIVDEQGKKRAKRALYDAAVQKIGKLT